MYKKVMGVMFAMLVMAGLGHAARPFGTDDAGTVDAGTFELELGYSFVISADHGLGLGLVHGITERMDIGIVMPYSLSPNGHLPSEVGVKFVVVQDNDGEPVYAVTFGSELGSGVYGFNNVLSLGLSDMALHLNLGLTSDGTLTNPAEINYNAFLEIPVGDKIVSGIEFTGAFEATPGSAVSLNTAVGLGMALSDSLVWDLGGDFGLVGGSDITLTTGITLAF